VGGSAWSAARQRVTERAGGTLVVRRAEVGDLAQVTEIERASFADPWTPDALATAMELPHLRFFVAAEGGGTSSIVVGYVVALVMGDEGEIADLAVDPSARRGGIGRLLLGRAEEEMVRCGVRTIYLEARESNVAALGLYEARGFEIVGRRRGYYRQPVEDALVLRREIAPT